MRMYRAVLTKVAAWSGLPTRVRDELVADALSAATRRRFGRCGELASVGAYSIRRRAAMTTGERPGRYVRQGSWVGGATLVVFGQAVFAPEAKEAHPWWLAMGLLISITVLAGATLISRHHVVACLAAAGLLGLAVTMSTGQAPHGLERVVLLVALPCLLAGERPGPIGERARLPLAVLVIGVTVVSMLAPAAAVSSAVLGVALALPILLFCCGRLDARLAVIGVSLWLFRIVAIDFSEWLGGAAFVAGTSVSISTERFLLMQAMFAIAVVVTQRSVRDAHRPAAL